MFFYSATTNGFYLKDPKNLPDVVEVSDNVYKELFIGQGQGKVISPDSAGYPVLKYPQQDLEDAELMEALWVKSEIDRAREELEKVQDSDPKAIGSVSDWRVYRKALRQWSENGNFPNKEFRPKAPDAI